MNISEFRQKYPQYNDMTDSALADSLYQKHYSDMPRQEFDSKFLAPTEPPMQPSHVPNAPLPIQGDTPTGDFAREQDTLNSTYSEGPLAQKALLAQIPLIGKLESLKSAPRLLNEQDTARRQAIGAPEAPINPSTAAALGVQTPMFMTTGAAFAPKVTQTAAKTLANVGKMGLIGGAENAAITAGTGEHQASTSDVLKSAAVGAVIPVTATGAGLALKGLASATKAGARMFKDMDKINLPPEQKKAIAEDIIVGIAEARGITVDRARALYNHYKGTDTMLVDLLGEPGAQTLGRAASQAGDQVDRLGSSLASRGSKSLRRIRDELPARTGVKIEDAIDYTKQLDANKRKIQERLYTDRMLNTELDNQDDLLKLISSRPNLKRAFNKAKTSLKNRGYEVKYSEAPPNPSKVGGDGAVEVAKKSQPVLDIRLADEMSDILSDSVSRNKIKGFGSKSQKALSLKNEWVDAVEEAAPTSEYATARRRWAKLKANERAYKLGEDEFQKVKGTHIGDYLKSLTPEERNAFKLGTTRGLFDGGGIQNVKNIDDPNIADKISKVFGKQGTKNLEQLNARETAYEGTQKSVTGNLSAGTKEIADAGVGGGKSAGLPILGHRRAYSPNGLLFATGDALMEAIQAKRIPKSIKQEITKILTQKGDLGPKVDALYNSKRIREALGRFGFVLSGQKQKMATMAPSSLVNALNGGQQ